MKKRPSFQGLHLPEAPGLDPKIETAPLPKKVVLLMEQHPGGICEPVVSKGDQVKTGQVVGKSDRFDLADLHATVSGTVSDVTLQPDPRGNKVPAVIIESDDRDEWVELPEPDEHFAQLKAEEALNRLRHAGIVEIGNPAVPLHVKVVPPELPDTYLFLVGIPVLKKVHTLIINAVDSEPNVFIRRGLLRHHPDDLIKGIRVLRTMVGAEKVVLAVSETDQLSIDRLGPYAKAGFELFGASDKYPSGLEPILVKQVSGKEIPLPDGTSRDTGYLVQDVVTVMNAVEALRDHKPQVDKLITVFGSSLSRPKNLRVRIGTPVRDVLGSLSIKPDTLGKVIFGGPLLGYAQYTLDVPITKETYALTLQNEKGVHEFSPNACFNCGACVDVCPINLLPNELSRFCEFGRFEQAENGFLLHCIECGLCGYVCPAARPMVHFMRYGKSEIAARKVGV